MNQMEPATLRKEIRESRSFHPDEFATALEQIFTGKAPKDHSDPVEFSRRMCLTRATWEPRAGYRKGLRAEQTMWPPTSSAWQTPCPRCIL